jgi:uncharacterized Tic20 family protein
LFRYLACLIGLFAVIAVAPARGQVLAQHAPAQKLARAQEGSPAQKPAPARTQPPAQSQGQVQGQPLGKAQALPPDQPAQPAPPPDQAAQKQPPAETQPPAQAQNQAQGQPLGKEQALPLPPDQPAKPPPPPKQNEAWPKTLVFVGGLLVVLVILLGGLIGWQWWRDASRAEDDKALEALRIVYGFWLIVYALLIALLVLVVTLSVFAPGTGNSSDIVAIIGTVTGLITTLTAAFFGIQAAGAGRSQAMTTLTQLKAQGPSGAVAYKLEPSYGPHSGGTRVSISGNGFTGANAVNFGVTPGANFVFENDGLVHANSPPAPTGVDEAKVFIIFPDISPPNREVGSFYYYTIEDAEGNPVDHGPPGKEVKIRGGGLKGAKEVMFGPNNKDENPKFESDGRLSVKVPNGKPGTDVDVTVVLPVDSPTNSFVVGKYAFDIQTERTPDTNRGGGFRNDT